MNEPLVHLKQFVNPIKKGYDPKTNQMEIYFTQLAVDRDSEVVLPQGIDLENFKKNPILVDSHDWYWGFESIIGRALPETLLASSKDLTGVIEFDVADPKAKTIAGKYERGYANAFSIGFIGREYGEPILEGQKGRTIVKCELLEISAVTVPSNPHATGKSFRLGEFYEMRKKVGENELENAYKSGEVDTLLLEIEELRIQKELDNLYKILNSI